MKHRSNPIQSPSLLAVIFIFAKILIITMMNLLRDIPSVASHRSFAFPVQVFRFGISGSSLERDTSGETPISFAKIPLMTMVVNPPSRNTFDDTHTWLHLGFDDSQWYIMKCLVELLAGDGCIDALRRCLAVDTDFSCGAPWVLTLCYAMNFMLQTLCYARRKNPRQSTSS